MNKTNPPIEKKLLKDLQERIRFCFLHNWQIPPILNAWIMQVAAFFPYEICTQMEAKKAGFQAMTYSYSKKEYMQLEKTIADVVRGGAREWCIVKDENTHWGLELWIKSKPNN